ncbi:MAG TPA: tetratricopeptide repeat protein [Burkholderiales bacterium]|nr:tetratricopeptide repeat protein [Burkholderiales bacterium]
MPEPPIPKKPTLNCLKAIQQAVQFHQQGRLKEAEQLYQAVLQQWPDNFDALHYLGVVRVQQGNAGAAVELIARALKQNSRSADAHSNLGNVFQALGRHDEGLSSFDRALAIKPDFADALRNRGIALQSLNRHGEALASYDKALAIWPGDAETFNNRGSALSKLNRYEEALASYDRALAMKPGYAEALNNRGNALKQLGRLDEALGSYDRALAINRNYPEAYYNRGNALRILRRNEEALASYDRALVLRPDYLMAIVNRGNALQDLNRHTEALASCERAIQVKPDFAGAHYNLGNVLRDLNRHEEAVSSYARALEIAPEFDYALGELYYSRMVCCDWAQYGEGIAHTVDKVRAGKRAASPFPFLALSDSAADQLQCSRIFVADEYPAASQPLWRGERYIHDRIRLAYLSADFREHASANLLAGMFEHHDRSRFETTAISFGVDDRSAMRSRLKDAFEHFIDVRNRSDLEVARLLRELEIDIVVDLMGHTGSRRMGILALRPAPVQVNFFCPGTSGADYLDYIVGDRVVIPEDHHVHYAEKVVYLPDTFQANDSKRPIADYTPSRAEAGLPDDGFVFCSFNNTYKFTPKLFDIWMRLLGGVEGSVLWLPESNATASRNLRREATQRGIAANRLVFAPRVPHLADHLARYRLADLFLDTLPYTAQTTASDALWAGLPVITCQGTTFVGRVAASLLNAVGLPELITYTLAEYETLALKLAIERKQLAGIKAKLAQNRGNCPLFDTDRFRRHIEAAYATMWERYQRGEFPVSFAEKPYEQQAGLINPGRESVERGGSHEQA